MMPTRMPPRIPAVSRRSMAAAVSFASVSKERCTNCPPSCVVMVRSRFTGSDPQSFLSSTRISPIWESLLRGGLARDKAAEISAARKKLHKPVVEQHDRIEDQILRLRQVEPVRTRAAVALQLR